MSLNGNQTGRYGEPNSSSENFLYMWMAIVYLFVRKWSSEISVWESMVWFHLCFHCCISGAFPNCLTSDGVTSSYMRKNNDRALVRHHLKWLVIRKDGQRNTLIHVEVGESQYADSHRRQKEGGEIRMRSCLRESALTENHINDIYFLVDCILCPNIILMIMYSCWNYNNPIALIF